MYGYNSRPDRHHHKQDMQPSTATLMDGHHTPYGKLDPCPHASDFIERLFAFILSGCWTVLTSLTVVVQRARSAGQYVLNNAKLMLVGCGMWNVQWLPTAAIVRRCQCLMDCGASPEKPQR